MILDLSKTMGNREAEQKQTRRVAVTALPRVITERCVLESKAVFDMIETEATHLEEEGNTRPSLGLFAIAILL